MACAERAREKSMIDNGETERRHLSRVVLVSFWFLVAMVGFCGVLRFGLVGLVWFWFCFGLVSVWGGLVWLV